jgi:hypothetical protein
MEPRSEVEARPRDWLVDRVRQVVAGGAARSVVVKRGGSVVVRVPLTTGVAGLVPAVLFVPQVTAVAAIVALLAGCTVEVVPAGERV